jgi:hypothetical protein
LITNSTYMEISGLLFDYAKFKNKEVLRIEPRNKIRKLKPQKVEELFDSNGDKLNKFEGAFTVGEYTVYSNHHILYKFKGSNTHSEFEARVSGEIG